MCGFKFVDGISEAYQFGRAKILANSQMIPVEAWDCHAVFVSEFFNDFSSLRDLTFTQV